MQGFADRSGVQKKVTRVAWVLEKYTADKRGRLMVTAKFFGTRLNADKRS